MPVLRFAKRLVEFREVVLHRGDDEQPAGPRQVASRPHQGKIILQGAVPAAALPRDRPPLLPGRRAPALDLHLRFVNRPGRHRLRTGGILGDHRLQDHEPEPGRRVFIDLLRVERQLPRPLPHRMRNRFTQIAGGQIDLVGLANVGGEITRPSAAESVEVPREQFLSAQNSPLNRVAFASRSAWRTRARSPASSGGPQGSSQAFSGITPSEASAHSIRRT